jgi:hypothetical protein
VLELMHAFSPKEWETIVARQELKIGDHEKAFRACISDQDAEEIKKIFSENIGTLTQKGTYLLAHRANNMLDADNFIATFLIKEVGNAELLKRN